MPTVYVIYRPLPADVWPCLFVRDLDDTVFVIDPSAPQTEVALHCIDHATPEEHLILRTAYGYGAVGDDTGPLIGDLCGDVPIPEVLRMPGDDVVVPALRQAM